VGGVDFVETEDVEVVDDTFVVVGVVDVDVEDVEVVP
jgi:hypothetical protein